MHSSLYSSLEQFLFELVRFRTDPNGTGHQDAAQWLGLTLERLGFVVRYEGPDTTPLIIAHRPALAGGQGQLVMYGHYDVDEVVTGWNSDPFELVAVDGRWVGLGVGDNKGAIASRLLALSVATTTPAITWIIQAEEETGSATLRQWLDSHTMPSARWYLDENGWVNPDGRTRLLLCARTEQAWLPLEDAQARAWSDCLSNPAGVFTVARVLNKIYVPGGCPFQSALPVGATYLSFGLNDSGTKIHHPNESILIQHALNHVQDCVRVLHHMATNT